MSTGSNCSLEIKIFVLEESNLRSVLLSSNGEEETKLGEIVVSDGNLSRNEPSRSCLGSVHEFYSPISRVL